MTEERTINVGVQVLPLNENPYPIVDAAIKVIQDSGVKYEIGPLETILEGDDLDRLVEIAKSAHRACFATVLASVFKSRRSASSSLSIKYPR